MQDDITTGSTGRTERTKKSSNGKWASKPASEMENEAGSSATVGTQAGQTLEGVVGSARTAFDSVVSRGSDLVSKVDLSRGTGVIREYPIYAAFGGLILGFILGAAITRRKI